MMTHCIHRLASTVLAVAFTLGFLTEGHHQCVATTASKTAEVHTSHNTSDNPAADLGTCECVGQCCAVAPLAWTPETQLDHATGLAEGRDPLELSSQHLPGPIRRRLPPAQGPPTLR